jgi:hypothetical protein
MREPTTSPREDELISVPRAIRQTSRSYFMKQARLSLESQFYSFTLYNLIIQLKGRQKYYEKNNIYV